MALIVHSDKVGNPKPGNKLTNNPIPTKSNPTFWEFIVVKNPKKLKHETQIQHEPDLNPTFVTGL